MLNGEISREILRREMAEEPLVPQIGGPYQRATKPRPEREPIVDLNEWPLSDEQKKTIQSIRAHQHLRRGRDSIAQGQMETAVLAFKAALHEVLKSEEPGDVAIRRSATQELIRLMRQEAF